MGSREALQIIFEGNAKRRYAKTVLRMWDNSGLSKLACRNDAHTHIYTYIFFCATQGLHSENQLLYMRLSLEFKEKIDDYLQLMGSNPFNTSASMSPT